MKLPLPSSVCDDGGRDAKFLEIYSTVTDIFAEYTPVYFVVTSKALHRSLSLRPAQPAHRQPVSIEHRTTHTQHKTCCHTTKLI